MMSSCLLLVVVFVVLFAVLGDIDTVRGRVIPTLTVSSKVHVA